MELIHNEIPKEFLDVLPEGIKYIAHRGKNFLVVEDVYCPNGHTLTVNTVKIHGESTIKIGIRIADQKGNFFIDSFWGSHNKLYDFIPTLKNSALVVEAVCPVCGASLMVEDQCGSCGTKAHIQMVLPGGKNRILVCGQLGCPGHRLDIQSAPDPVIKKVSDINFFGSQIDDLFGGI
jgi:hypothetical protein